MPSIQYKDTNGIVGSSTAAMDYDPSILIVSQQAIWPKTDTIALGNFNTACGAGQYHTTKDQLPNSSETATSEPRSSSNSSLPSASQYYKNHRTLSKESPTSTTHIHCSIQGSQQPNSKSSFSNLSQTTEKRTSSRDESPMVVVQVTDG